MGAKTKNKGLKNTEALTQFNADNQPPADLKKMGHAKRKILSNILQAKLPLPDGFEGNAEIKELAKNFGVKPEQLSIELAMALKMAHRAIYMGDVAAYTALMNRAYGLPVMPIATKTDKTVHLNITFNGQAEETEDAEIISN